METPKNPLADGTQNDLDGGWVWPPPAEGGRAAPLVVDTKLGTVVSLGEAAGLWNASTETQAIPYLATRTSKTAAGEPAIASRDTKARGFRAIGQHTSVRLRAILRPNVLILSLSAIVLAETVALALFTIQIRAERQQRAANAPLAEAQVSGSGQAYTSSQELTATGGPAASEASRQSQLSIRTPAAGASVYVDGKRQGESPVSLSGLTAGEHIVRVDSAGASAEQKVTLTPGSNAVFMVLGRSTSSGWLDVRAPAAVQITERGKVLGSSSDGPVVLSTGTHRLLLRNEALGYSQEVQVTIPAGDIARVRPSFPDGVLQLNAQPWASVLIDGKPVGDTPLGKVAVALGPHEIRFRHPELGEQIRNVTVTADSATRVSVDLRK